MWIKQLRNTSHTPYTDSEFCKMFLSVKSTNNIKTKITCHKVVGHGCIWEEIWLMNAYWVGQGSINF